MVVLPLVPVMPTRRRARPSVPRTRADTAPSTARGCSTTTAGRATPAAVIRSTPVAVGEHGQRPGRGRLAGEVGAVGPRAGQGRVEVPGEHGPRVEGHPGDGHLRGRVAGIHEGGEVPEGSAAELGRSGNGHVERPYRSLRLCPLRRTVGSASASSGVTLRVTFGGFLPVGGIFSSCRA